METIAVVALVGLMNIICLAMGARIGQRVSKGEPAVPECHPLEAMRTRQEQKERQAEQEKIDRILANIERYDGTETGQQDVEEVNL